MSRMIVNNFKVIRESDGFASCMGQCIACRAIISFNPLRVPSIKVNGQKEPLCLGCFDKWNEIHRTSKGLPRMPLHPDAYEPCDEGELAEAVIKRVG